MVAEGYSSVPDHISLTLPTSTDHAHVGQRSQDPMEFINGTMPGRILIDCETNLPSEPRSNRIARSVHIPRYGDEPPSEVPQRYLASEITRQPQTDVGTEVGHG